METLKSLVGKVWVSDPRLDTCVSPIVSAYVNIPFKLWLLPLTFSPNTNTFQRSSNKYRNILIFLPAIVFPILICVYGFAMLKSLYDPSTPAAFTIFRMASCLFLLYILIIGVVYLFKLDDISRLLADTFAINTCFTGIPTHNQIISSQN